MHAASHVYAPGAAGVALGWRIGGGDSFDLTRVSTGSVELGGMEQTKLPGNEIEKGGRMVTLYRAGATMSFRTVSLFNSIERSRTEGMPHDRNGPIARGGLKRLHAGPFRTTTRVASNRQNPLEWNGRCRAQTAGNFCKHTSTAMSSLARFSADQAWRASALRELNNVEIGVSTDHEQCCTR